MACLLYLGQYFKSFEEFTQTREKYQVQNNMVWVTQSSRSIISENLMRTARKQKPLDPELAYKNIVFSCKFGGLQRIKKGANIRPNQSTWKVNCPAILQLIANEAGLRVTKLKEIHCNHECTEEEMDVMPENRKVHRDDQATFMALVKEKVKPARIRHILREMKTTRITARDIANHRAKMQRAIKAERNDDEILKDTILDIGKTDPSATIHIEEDSDDVLTMLFIQSSAMSENVSKYGQVIILDHNYKIERNRMAVSLLTVMDGNGLRRLGGVVYVANDDEVTLSSIVKSFRDSISPEVAEEVKTFIVDKDWSEACTISEVFPNCHIQLCDLYVWKTFSKASAKEGKSVKKILEDLRFCTEDDTFSELCDKLKEASSSKFYTYFEENWLNCTFAWSFRNKKSLLNPGNSTGNPLDKFNVRAKMVFNSDFSMNESLQMLLKFIANPEKEVRSTKISPFVKHKYIIGSLDPVLEIMVNELTKFACDLVRYEKEQADAAEVRENTTEFSCDCPHFVNYFSLPCRHILKFRSDNDLPWYDSSTYHSMWKVPNPVNTIPEGIPSGTVVCRTIPANKIPKDETEKYSMAMLLCQEICSVLRECEESQYGIRYKALDDMLKTWREGEEIHVSKVVHGKIVDGTSQVSNVTTSLEEQNSHEFSFEEMDGVTTDTTSADAEQDIDNICYAEAVVVQDVATSPLHLMDETETTAVVRDGVIIITLPAS